MTRVPYEDEIIISWVELHRDARFLSQELHRKGPWKGIIAVTRGGLVPAALVARELDIRLVDTICVTCAPTIVDFTTSSAVCTPPVIASDAFTNGATAAVARSRGSSSTEVDR